MSSIQRSCGFVFAVFFFLAAGCTSTGASVREEVGDQPTASWTALSEATPVATVGALPTSVEVGRANWWWTVPTTEVMMCQAGMDTQAEDESGHNWCDQGGTFAFIDGGTSPAQIMDGIRLFVNQYELEAVNRFEFANAALGKSYSCEMQPSGPSSCSDTVITVKYAGPAVFGALERGEYYYQVNVRVYDVTVNAPWDGGEGTFTVTAGKASLGQNPYVTTFQVHDWTKDQ